MDRIRIGAAQIPQTSEIRQNLAKALEAVKRAAGEGVELVCLPETHLAGYRVGVSEPDAPCDTDALDQALSEISAACHENNIGAIVGTETSNSREKPFNSAVVFDDQGRRIAIHHKTRLTPGDARGYSPGPTRHFSSSKGFRWVL